MRKMIIYIAFFLASIGLYIRPEKMGNQDTVNTVKCSNTTPCQPLCVKKRCKKRSIKIIDSINKKVPAYSPIMYQNPWRRSSLDLNMSARPRIPMPISPYN